MSTTITRLAAQEHINDLLREAHDARRRAEVRRPRRIRFAAPRLLTPGARRTATA
jgi:hypothetical protein